MQENQLNVQLLCSSLFPTNDYSALALGLFQYFQQNHFTKKVSKEVSLAVDTSYTEQYKDEIKEMAGKLGLLGEKSLTQRADVAFVIGGRAKTNQIYLHRLQQEDTNHGIGQYYIFLSTRKLLTDTSDNPESTEAFPYDGSGKDYRHYLAEKYRIDVSEVTEGHSMQERYDYVFGKETPKVIFFEIDSQNAQDFYEAAISKALNEGYSSFAISAINPYLEKYRKQVENLCRQQNLENVTIQSYGPAGIEDPKILAQALAMRIDTDYESAAARIKQETGIDALPINWLRNNTRDKTVLDVPLSYQEFLDKITPSPDKNKSSLFSGGFFKEERLTTTGDGVTKEQVMTPNKT